MYLRRQYRRLAAKAGQEKEEMEYRRRCMCRWEKEEEKGEGGDEMSWAGPMCVSTYIVLTGLKFQTGGVSALAEAPSVTAISSPAAMMAGRAAVREKRGARTRMVLVKCGLVVVVVEPKAVF